MNLKTIHDAAEALGVSESRIRRAANAGALPTMKLGNRTLVDIDAMGNIFNKPEGVPIETVSKQTGLTVGAIRAAIYEGWMPCEKPGRAYLFDLKKVHAAIMQRMQAQKE